MDELDKLLADFFSEALDGLQSVEDNLLLLEQGDAPAVQAVFRALHTIKGNSSFLDLMAINKLSHELENLLDAVRKGALACSPPLIDLLLTGVDRLRTLIRTHPQDVEIIDLVDRARTLRERGGTQSSNRLAVPAAAPSSASTNQKVNRPAQPAATTSPAPPVGGFAGFLLARHLVAPEPLLEAVLAQDFGHESAIAALRGSGVSAEACLGLLLAFRDKTPGLLSLARDRKIVSAEQCEALTLEIQRSRPSIAETLVRLEKASTAQVNEWLATYMAESRARG